MLNKLLTLIVCSNRKNNRYQLIWHQIINDRCLKKILFCTQGLARQNTVNHKKIIQLKLTSKGRSNALNEAFGIVDSKIIGLTDDDCIVGRKWTQYAVKTLSNNSVDLVYGQTKSFQPFKHKGKFCPSIFKKSPNKYSITNKIGKHWENVGFDNNVAIKQHVVDNIGGYKWWLGPGSIIPAAEDAEFILRAQIAGYKIAYNPKMIVYHNKWLSSLENEKLMLDYSLGGLTVYGYYTFQGVVNCKPIMILYINYFFYEIKKAIKMFIYLKLSFYRCLKLIFKYSFYLIKGIFVAFFFARVLPIPERENVVKKYYL